MKKRKIANIIMVIIILMIAAAGIFTVGHIQGWFEKADGQTAALTDIRGIVNLQRQGTAYSVQEETVLRSGDQITCTPGATAVICIGDSCLTLGENACIAVSDPLVQSFTAAVTSGEVFVNAGAPVVLTLDGRNIPFMDTVASLSVRSGAQSISVFAGTVENAQAGQMLNWVGDALSVAELSIRSLNDFNITQIRKANEQRVLCFADTDLDRLEEMQAQVHPSEPDETKPSETQAEGTMTVATEPTSAKPTVTQPTATDPPAVEGTKPSAAETIPPETEPAATESMPPETGTGLTCTLSIRCDTILDNWDDLNPAKAGFVPSNGWILNVTMTFIEGETVFDVLKRACSAYGVQLEYSYSPIYGSYYIEGINNLYQYDCGSQSGWMYQVNGWFPNYGCSGYTLSDGDMIGWCYTCNGYGADVGA